MSRRYTSVTVDVDLSDIDDDDIMGEAEARGFGSNAKQDIVEMFYAFHLGKTERAVELARKVAQDVTGRTLA